MAKGLDIVLKDVSYERRALGYDVPVKRGCLGWWFLGGDLDYSCINLADGMPDAIPVGVPIVSPYYLSFKSKSRYLRTQTILPSTWSLMAVRRAPLAGATNDVSPIYIGTSDGTDSGGSLYSSSIGNDAMMSYGATINNGTTVSGTKANWEMIIASADNVGQGIYNMTKETSTTESQSPSEPRVPSINKIGIGSGGGDASSFAGECDLACVAIYNVVLTSTERTAIYNRVQAYLANRSITI